MKTSTLVAVVLALVVVLGGWYWLSSNQGAAPPPSGTAGINGSPNQGNLGQPATGEPQQPAAGADVSDITQNITLGTSGSAALGTYLIGWTDMTLYTYAKDSTGTSTCYGKCARNWPPYAVPAGMHLNIKSGVSSALAGTIVRADGTTQVTYKGMPLYFYSGDASGSDTNGQGVGGVWYVVAP